MGSGEGDQGSANRLRLKARRGQPMAESGDDVERTRWPALGSANDAATIQANERTMLAWMRTGISLTTFGFVIGRLGIWIRIAGDASQGIRGAGWIGALFVLIGAVLDAIGIARYLMFHR